MDFLIKWYQLHTFIYWKKKSIKKILQKKR